MCFASLVNFKFAPRNVFVVLLFIKIVTTSQESYNLREDHKRVAYVNLPLLLSVLVWTDQMLVFIKRN